MQSPTKVLLTTLNAKYIHINLAIRLLYALNQPNKNLFWKEFTIKQTTQEIANDCLAYDVVCFSCYIWNIHQTLAVCELIKKINPQIKILLGGPEVSYDWHDVIQFPYVDYIITGEGEIPFTAFLQQYPYVKGIGNLAYKTTNGEVVYHKANQNFDINVYTHINPYQYDVPETLFNRVLYIETSRGCPYKCEFCLASLDNKVRYLPMQQIKDNLLYLMQHGKTIKFLDRTFNVKKDFTLEIFEFILQHAKPYHVFQFEITADILHPAIMQFIKDRVPKGMFRFEIGIQTVNQKANLEVSRKQNFDKTSAVVKELSNYVEMHLDLIVGLPLDYWDDVKYSIEQVLQLQPPELQLGFLKFLKGTPVREKYEQYGYVFDSRAPYQIIESNYLSKQELAKITLVEHALEIYWNKKRLLNVLKYVLKNYSVFDFLLGLGTAFAQKHPQFISYTLLDIYNIAQAYIETFFAHDTIIKELLAIDYYLQHKVKPAASIVQEVDRKLKFVLLDELRLPHQTKRYIVLPISFNWLTFVHEQHINPSAGYLIIEYTGNSLPVVINKYMPLKAEATVNA